MNSFRRYALPMLALVSGLALMAAGPSLADEVLLVPDSMVLRLGDPPRAASDASGLPRRSGAFAANPLSVATSDRAAVSRFYRLYKAAGLVPSEWTGNVSGCVAGNTSAEYKEAVRLQINFFRAMAGVPAAVAIDSSFSGKDQQAALMMSANGSLSHFPPASWLCFTSTGAEAAGKSNLALGQSGPFAVKGYMDDPGSGNAFVGHRRWILYPQTQLMGTGDVSDSLNGGNDTNALWVQDANIFTARPATRDDFVAWPPPGFFPYDLVPARWSLSYPEADFSAASVSVTSGGRAVPVELEVGANGAVGYGENTFVWVVDNRSTSSSSVPPRPTADLPYRVVISGAKVGSQVKNFDYTVNMFDADPASASGMTFSPATSNLTVGRSIVVSISGASGSIVGASTSFSGGSRPIGVQFASSTSLKLTGLAAGSATITVTDAAGNKASLTVPVGAQASSSDWQIAGRADGIGGAMTLIADVLPASADDGKSGSYFLAALLPGGQLFLHDGRGWVSYAGGAIPSRSSGQLAQRSFPVYVGFDSTGLSGTQVLVGYGTDANDMLANGKFKSIYTIP